MIPTPPLTQITIRSTPALTPEQIEARIAACAACPHNLALNEHTFHGKRTVTVRCAQCKECAGGRNLTSALQECPLGYWKETHV